jgi:hypothetical protein
MNTLNIFVDLDDWRGLCHRINGRVRNRREVEKTDDAALTISPDNFLNFFKKEFRDRKVMFDGSRTQGLRNLQQEYLPASDDGSEGSRSTQVDKFNFLTGEGLPEGFLAVSSIKEEQEDKPHCYKSIYQSSSCSPPRKRPGKTKFNMFGSNVIEEEKQFQTASKKLFDKKSVKGILKRNRTTLQKIKRNTYSATKLIQKGEQLQVSSDLMKTRAVSTFDLTSTLKSIKKVARGFSKDDGLCRDRFGRKVILSVKHL